jgi:hypothetical protein
VRRRGDADLPSRRRVAQAYCSPVAVKAAEECVQLHGGIGFTWEHPAHLFLKRAKADAAATVRPTDTGRPRRSWSTYAVVEMGGSEAVQGRPDGAGASGPGGPWSTRCWS